MKKTLFIVLIFLSTLLFSFAQSTPTGTTLQYGMATTFGHNRNGSLDRGDNGVTACGQNSRHGIHESAYRKYTRVKGLQKRVPKNVSPDPEVCNFASLPESTLKELYGYEIPIGKPSDIQLLREAQCDKFKNKFINVCNASNSICEKFKVVEIGPTEKLKNKPNGQGHIVDLTGCGMNRIDPNGSRSNQKLRVYFYALEEKD